MLRHNLTQVACERISVTELCAFILDRSFGSQSAVDNLNQLIVHEGILYHKIVSFSMLV